MGDGAASFEELFRAHYPGALRLAFLYSGDRAAAEEAVAEAVARVFVRWQAGQVSHVGPYLRQAVVNELRQRGRRGAAARRMEQRWRGGLRGVRSASEEVADRDELVRALARLPERQRLAVVLRYFEELSEAETAEVMGVSVGGVKSQTSRGLARLRELLRGAEVGS